MVLHSSGALPGPPGALEAFPGTVLVTLGWLLGRPKWSWGPRGLLVAPGLVPGPGCVARPLLWAAFSRNPAKNNFSRSRPRPRVLVVFGGPLALTPGPCAKEVGGLISGPLAAINTCGCRKKWWSGRGGRLITFRTPCGRTHVRVPEKTMLRKRGSADYYPDPLRP